jgi:hypothetical protein
MNLKRSRVLGVYLLAAASCQLALYLAMTVSSEEGGWLMYFDPRIGIFFLESVVRGSESLAPGVLRWLSAFWILAIGLSWALGHPRLKTYVISEIVLLIPNVGFFLLIVLANLSPAHGFSVGELLFPSLIMVVFSVIPLWLAFWARGRQDEVVSLNLSRA